MQVVYCSFRTAHTGTQPVHSLIESINQSINQSSIIVRVISAELLRTAESGRDYVS